MMSRFSVVIPTRNRSNLLRNALQSSVDQDFQDYEVIISNNWSEDDTRAAVEPFLSHSSVKYFETSNPLSMADHWEFALDKARGEWVLFLCDDDVLLPNALSVLNGLTAEPNPGIIEYNSLRYFYDDGLVEKGNLLQFWDPINESTTEVSSSRQLDFVFANISGRMPKFLNSAVRRDVFEKIRRAHKRVFHRWAPDYSAGVLLLAHTEKYLKSQKPLSIFGKSLKSYGSGSLVNPDHLKKFYLEFPEFDGSFYYSPYPQLMTVTNGLYDTVSMVQEELGKKWRIDPRRFRMALLTEIRTYVSHGHTQYLDYAEIVEADLARLKDRVRTVVGEQVRRVRQLSRPLWRRLFKPTTRLRRVSGKDTDGSFANISEAATWFHERYG